MIHFEGVTKSFDGKLAVSDIDLHIEENRLFGLIGPNGAGKTTSLRMMATLMKPESGSITVDGLDALRDVHKVRNIVGYMPDAFGTFRGLSCDEYLLFFGQCHGLYGKGLHSRVDAVLELTDLAGHREELTSALSTGMRQRLSLAKTLIHDPKILILDEPASGLDPRARIEIRAFLKELTDMGKTIVISSHILADLEEICTDIAIIEHGQVVWSGPIDAATDTASAEQGMVVSIEVAKGEVTRASELLGKHPEVLTVREGEGDSIDVELVAYRASFRSAAPEESDPDSASDSDGVETPAENAGSAAPDPNTLLTHLIEAKIEIVHYSRRQKNLERLFLASTRGLSASPPEGETP